MAWSRVTVTISFEVDSRYADRAAEPIRSGFANAAKVVAGGIYNIKEEINAEQISQSVWHPSEARLHEEVGESRDGEAEGDGAGASPGEDSVGETGRGDTEGPLPAPSKRAVKKARKAGKRK